ncbi:protein kinase domain-containing protein [Pseudolysinimonas sp.]|uniref:protein kinase domain-containing protein n=1 Tax=Pseudolysinimonas sp. TaxID=2680009 RepID=UPI003F7F570D
MDEAGEIAGYRVLRRIERGARSTVFLAHGGEPPGTVVLKVTGADDPAALREAAALDRGAGAHIIELRDAAADDDRLVLVLPRLGDDLAHLLAERAELEGGEAVTILAPLAETVRRLHAAGVAHGALTAACVRFDADGAPTLTGFGSSSVFEAGLPEVALERVPEVAADRAALRELAAAVLARVGGARREAAQRLHVEVLAAPDAEIAGRIAGGIFEVAAALPVRMGDAPTTTGSAHGRVVPVGSPVAEVRPTPKAWAWATRVEELLDRSPAAELAAAARARWARWSSARRRLVLGVGAGALSLVVAVLVIPAPTPGGAVAAGERSASPAPAATSTGSSRDAATDPAVTGDDPVAAATPLLRARASCRDELSILCLDAADQPDSAAADADREAIRVGQVGGRLPPDPLAGAGDAPPALTERIGGSALIAVGGGVSLLLVRGDDGWRIRDIIAPEPAATPGQTATPPPGR